MDAVILAGGQSRRLGGVAKAGLVLSGQTLLARTVDAVAEMLLARAVDRSDSSPRAGSSPRTAHGEASGKGGLVVVGPAESIADWLTTARTTAGIRVVQEDPPFSGPAAGLAAGVAALEEAAPDALPEHVLVLSCDMPYAGEVAALLAAEVAGCSPDTAVMAVDAGRRQPLAAIYPLTALGLAITEARAAHRLENASVFSLLATVIIKEIVVPSGLTADIDTWEDARAQGIVVEPPSAKG